MSDQASEWTLEPASAHDGWTLETAPEHGGLADLAHKIASYLPTVGGFGGAILGGMGGAAIGAPAGLAAIATGAAGAGVGGAMGGAAGKGLQHVIDTQLGYEKPIQNASDLGSRLADMGRAGLEEGEDNATGSAIAGVAMPVIRPVARAVARGARSAAGNLAARVVGGTAGQYASAGAEKVSKMGNFLLDAKGITPTNLSLGAVSKRLPAIEQATGQELTNSIGALDATGERVSKGDLARRFNDLAIEAGKKGPAADAQVQKYLNARDRIIDDIFDNGTDMSFADAEAWKRGYQEPINYAKMHKTVPEMGQIELASAARQGVEDAAGNAAAAHGGELQDNFLAAKERSGLAQTAGDMAEGAVGRSEARGLIGPTARIGGYMAAIGALASGHPVGAAVGLASAPIAQYAKNRSVGAAAVGLRGASNALMSVAKTEPWKLGPYAGILVNALRDGEDSFNANAYSLSQTEPGFQALSKQLGETK